MRKSMDIFDDMVMNLIELVSRSPQQTQGLGEWLGKHLPRGSVVLLSGNLGAGKTHLAQGIARGTGVAGYVTSPTFTLINEYRSGRIPLYHIDLYRLRNAAEAASLGLDDYLYSDGISIVEWPEQAPDFMPHDALQIQIAHTGVPDMRAIQISSDNPLYTDLLHDLQATNPEMQATEPAR